MGNLIGIDIGGTKCAVLLGRDRNGHVEIASRVAFPTEPKEARAVNLLEQPVDGKVEFSGNAVEFEYRAYRVGNLLIRF